MIQIEQPPGIRATSRGGEWKFVRGPAPRSVNFFSVEYDQLLSICSRADQYAIKEEMAALMTRAAEGRCTFGRGKGYDVDFMTCTNTILELRFLSTPKISGHGPLHIRLYFTEPAHLPGFLYAAKLAWKHGGSFGKSEQTRHAIEAEKRVKEFFR